MKTPYTNAQCNTATATAIFIYKWKPANAGPQRKIVDDKVSHSVILTQHIAVQDVSILAASAADASSQAPGEYSCGTGSHSCKDSWFTTGSDDHITGQHKDITDKNKSDMRLNGNCAAVTTLRSHPFSSSDNNDGSKLR